MENIIHLPASEGSFVGGFEIWRLPGGAIYGKLTEMPPRVVESILGEPHEKMLKIADLFDQAATSMREQATLFTPNAAESERHKGDA